MSWLLWTETLERVDVGVQKLPDKFQGVLEPLGLFSLALLEQTQSFSSSLRKAPSLTWDHPSSKLEIAK